MGAKRSSAIFAAGETRRGEASGNASSLDVWLLVEMGTMWKDKWLCSLQNRTMSKTPLIAPPPSQKNTNITAFTPWQCTYGYMQKTLWLFLHFLYLTREKRSVHGKNVQRERGKRVMELIYKQNDNQLQSRQRERLRERNAGRQLEREDWEVRLRLERDCGLLGGCGSP